MSISSIGYNQNTDLASWINRRKTANQSEETTMSLTDATSKSEEANTAHRAAISASSLVSNEGAAVLLQQQEQDSSDQQQTTFVMDSNKGTQKMDLDAYFSDNPKISGNLMDVPLLLPTGDNIKALSQHASGRFKQMMADYGIPNAPEKITYDSEGNIHFPPDYPYADELTQALDENPGLANELQTINALTSVYADLRKIAPFQEEYAQAKTQAEIDAVIAKYSHLFQSNAHHSKIALTFSEEGNIGLESDGKPFSLT